MNRSIDPERILDAFLAPEEDRLADRVIDAALADIARTPQRRALRVPWRFPLMPARSQYWSVAAAVLAVAIGAGALAYLGSPGPAGSLPTPTASATPSPSPSSVSPSPSTFEIDTTGWTAYTSSQYGFSLAHPPNFTVTPATRDWTFEQDGQEFVTPAADAFMGPNILVSAWAIPLDPGVTEDNLDFVAWVEDYCARTFAESCESIRDRIWPLCNEIRDCHPGVLVLYPTETQAYFTGGNYGPDRMIVVSVWRPEDHASAAPYGGARQLLLAVLSTMDVHPAP